MPKSNSPAHVPAEAAPDALDAIVPRSAEDARVQELVNEALKAGPGNIYETPEEFLRAMRARVQR